MSRPDGDDALDVVVHAEAPPLPRRHLDRRDLRDDRLRTTSQFVSVEVGDRRKRLYEEVVRRTPHVPEPATLLLLGSGLMVLGLLGRWRAWASKGTKA